jgi:hypothetical protein
MNYLKENISKNVHEHSFSNIILDLSSNYHCIWLGIYLGPSLNVWLSICFVIPSFRMTFDTFSLTLCTKLGLPHFMARGLFRYICVYPINLTSVHLFHCVHGGKHITTHDVVWDSFASFVKDVGFHVLCEQTHVLMVPYF